MSTPISVDPAKLPLACTLGPNDGLERWRRWRALVDGAKPIAARDGWILEVRFQPGAGVLGELASLVAAEQECCAFLTWTVTEDDGSPLLRIIARPDSPDEIAAIAALFGVS